MAKTAAIWNLPEDILTDIFIRLPVKGIMRSRCTCKHWYTLLSHTRFANLHLLYQLNHQSITHPNLILSYSDNGDSDGPNYFINFPDHGAPCNIDAIRLDHQSLSPSMHVIGSSNGLLCLSDYKTNLSIWNPTTNKFWEFPYVPPPRPPPFRMCNTLRGFGYDSDSMEYKYIRIMLVPQIEMVETVEVMVHTIGSSSWRRIQDTSSHLPIFPSRPMVYVNGALHLMGIDWANSRRCITYFSLKNEKFREFPLPAVINDGTLGVLQGCLAVFSHVFCGLKEIEIWVMKDYGRKESWTRVFSIRLEPILEEFYMLDPLFFLKNGELLFLKNQESFVLYDPVNNSFKSPNIPGLPQVGANNRIEVFAYVESFISVASFMDRKRIGNVDMHETGKDGGQYKRRKRYEKVGVKSSTI